MLFIKKFRRKWRIASKKTKILCRDWICHSPPDFLRMCITKHTFNVYLVNPTCNASQFLWLNMRLCNIVEVIVTDMVDYKKWPQWFVKMPDFAQIINRPDYINITVTNAMFMILNFVNFSNGPLFQGAGQLRIIEKLSKGKHWPILNLTKDTKWKHYDGLVQDCSNSSALAMELLQSCTEPSISVSHHLW